jgi:hypothetical protein
MVIVTGALVLIRLILWLRDQSFIAGFTAEFLCIAVPTLSWLVIWARLFVHAPDARSLDLLPGAVFVGVGVQILHLVTAYSMTRLLASKSETDGAIGAALAILL